MDEQIETVDIFSSDPRIAFIAEFYKSPNPGNWYVPLLVCDKPDVRQVLESYILSRGQRICIHACWTWKHYYVMLLNYLGGY